MPSGLYPRESLHSRGPSCALGKQLYFQVPGTNPSEPLRLGCNPGPGLSVLLFCSPVHPSLNLKAISSKEKPVAGMSLLLQTIYRNWAPPAAPEALNRYTFKIGSHYGVQTSLKFSILLPLPNSLTQLYNITLCFLFRGYYVLPLPASPPGSTDPLSDRKGPHHTNWSGS